MNVADELQKLQQLRDSGTLTEDEFVQAKAKLLQGSETHRSGQQGFYSRDSSQDIERQARQWAMFLHLSQLAGFAVPIAGLVVPIVLWQMKKEELPGIDEHGKVVMNWIISEIIYGIASLLLMLVLIGIPLLIALGIVGIIFPILGGIKANNGELWPYPLSIRFLK
jgi:uncharacterized Tic20 family protein